MRRGGGIPLGGEEIYIVEFEDGTYNPHESSACDKSWCNERTLVSASLVDRGVFAARAYKMTN